jgi:hypothetical protein
MATNPDTTDTQLDLLLSLERIINEAERARVLRDRLFAAAREKAVATTQKNKSASAKEGQPRG